MSDYPKCLQVKDYSLYPVDVWYTVLLIIFKQYEDMIKAVHLRV